MTLPLLVSVPHAGLGVPEELESLSLLAPAEIAQDGDAGAFEIYDLGRVVRVCIRPKVARAFVDLNRDPGDFRDDGVIKTQTCYAVPIYRNPPDPSLIRSLLARYHRPYHRALTRIAANSRVRCGIDGHTMAAFAPPTAENPGEKRPEICVSDGDGATCDPSVTRSLIRALEAAFEVEVTHNDPFRGGYVSRSHARELPWIQIEFARTEERSPQEKRELLVQGLIAWCGAQGW